MRIQDQVLPAAIPDNEEIVPGLERPSEPGIAAYGVRFRVVLNETGLNQIRVKRIGGLPLPQPLDEVALFQVPEIILRADAKLPASPRRCPFNVVLPLGGRHCRNRRTKSLTRFGARDVHSSGSQFATT